MNNNSNERSGNKVGQFYENNNNIQQSNSAEYSDGENDEESHLEFLAWRQQRDGSVGSSEHEGLILGSPDRSSSGPPSDSTSTSDSLDSDDSDVKIV